MKRSILHESRLIDRDTKKPKYATDGETGHLCNAQDIAMKEIHESLDMSNVMLTELYRRFMQWINGPGFTLQRRQIRAE